jgi:hypothetical protein
MDPKQGPGLCIATKCSIVDLLGPIFYMSAHYWIEILCTISDPVNTISCFIGHDFLSLWYTALLSVTILYLVGKVVLVQGCMSWPLALGDYSKSPHLIRMTILVAKLQYFISVKTLSVDSLTWNSQNVNLMLYYC